MTLFEQLMNIIVIAQLVVLGVNFILVCITRKNYLIVKRIREEMES